MKSIVSSAVKRALGKKRCWVESSNVLPSVGGCCRWLEGREFVVGFKDRESLNRGRERKKTETNKKIIELARSDWPLVWVLPIKVD